MVESTRQEWFGTPTRGWRLGQNQREMIFLLILGKQCHQIVSEEEVETYMRTFGNIWKHGLLCIWNQLYTVPTIEMD